MRKMMEQIYQTKASLRGGLKITLSKKSYGDDGGRGIVVVVK